MGLRLVRSNPRTKSAKRNPLKRGKSRQVIAGNVRKMEREGYPKKQAVAASLRKAGVRRRRVAKNPRKRRKYSSAVLFGFKQSGLKPTMLNFKRFIAKHGGKPLESVGNVTVYQFSDKSLVLVTSRKVKAL